MTGRREQIAIVLAFAIVLATGCSSIKTASERLGFTKSAAEVQGTFFAGADRLSVRDAPNGSAKVVGELALHQKVVRSQVSGGYALIRTVDGNLSGWVANSKLLWKLPSSEAAAAEAPATADEVPATVEEAPAPSHDAEESQAPPPDNAEQEQPARKSGTGASVFDPY